MEDIMRAVSRNLGVGEQDTLRVLKVQGNHLVEFIRQSTPAGREQSLAVTKLEEAVMWASKALTK